jgi:hypothetical protein
VTTFSSFPIRKARGREAARFWVVAPLAPWFDCLTKGFPMTGVRLDAFARRLAHAANRRAVLSGLLGSAGVALAVVGAGGRGRAQTRQQATPINTDPGSLVRTTMTSRVGVLLEDFPVAMRDRVAAAVLAQPDEWWIERARWQLRLTYVHLVYRKYYFPSDERDSKNALPLPPEENWSVVLAPGGPARTTVDGHDVVAVDYDFSGTLLSDVDSPGISEPALGAIGGTWDEAFVFPVDPTLLLQRTGFACISEEQFPPDSVDAEEAYRFYDHTCLLELPGDVFGRPLCHFAEPLPQEDCVDALSRVVGRVDTSVHYERLAWDAALADAVRSGEVTTPDAPDLSVLTTGEGLNDNRIIYRYVEADSCEVVEGCVGGSGWRRLLIFDSHDHNVGGQPLVIGPVDYFVEGLGGELIDHNVYTLSECHNHFHFQYYGNFSFGSASGRRIQKNGFCLESTDRLSNNETSPLHTNFVCEHQGVSAGWGDLYGSSLVCNWVDITDVDTSAGPVTDDLTFHSNPDGFLCEGELVKDASGAQVWEPTEFRSPDGAVVDRPLCVPAEGVEDNDVGSVEVTIPVRGGFMTAPCRSDQDLGPLRNCGFTLDETLLDCAPGEPVSLTCTGGDPAKPQVLRVCETSQVLGTGVDCSHRDALANVVLDAASITITLTCPAARDATEPGGQIALYTAPVFEPDGPVAITCVQ